MHSEKICLKIVVLSLWACLILFLLFLWKQSGIALTEVPSVLSGRLREFGIFSAALVYIFLHVVRPVTLFPGMWLNIASGLLFGPWFGILFTVIGGNLSANVSFLIAKILGRDWIHSRETGEVKKWEHHLRQNGMVTVMLLRLLYLPYDAVSYGCGLTFMRHRDFALGTFIGTFPSITTYVLLGGIASPHTAGGVVFLGSALPYRFFIILLSVLFLFLGLLIAKFMYRRLLNESDR